LLFMRCGCRANGGVGLSSVTQNRLCEGWAGLEPAEKLTIHQVPCVIQDRGGKTNQASNR
jgi:hypothetical protein